MATRTIHADVIVRSMHVPFIMTVNDDMTYAEVAAALEAAAQDTVRQAVPQLATEVRITLEVGE